MSGQTIFPGPTPPYTNVPIAPQNFSPSRFTISSIQLGFTTLITTSTNHNYIVGQLVRLIIPPTFGSRQLNQRVGYVINIPSSNQILLDINSSQNVDAFISSPLFGTTLPETLAIGDNNSGIISSTGRVVTNITIPGSFQNISI
jgi:hypothetical protein